jgi:hypothetical protein
MQPARSREGSGTARNEQGSAVCYAAASDFRSTYTPGPEGAGISPPSSTISSRWRATRLASRVRRPRARHLSRRSRVGQATRPSSSRVGLPRSGSDSAGPVRRSRSLLQACLTIARPDGLPAVPPVGKWLLHRPVVAASDDARLLPHAQPPGSHLEQPLRFIVDAGGLLVAPATSARPLLKFGLPLLMLSTAPGGSRADRPASRPTRRLATVLRRAVLGDPAAELVGVEAAGCATCPSRWWSWRPAPASSSSCPSPPALAATTTSAAAPTVSRSAAASAPRSPPPTPRPHARRPRPRPRRRTTPPPPPPHEPRTPAQPRARPRHRALTRP